VHGKGHVNGVGPPRPYFIHKYISFIEFIFYVIYALNPFVCLLVGRLNTLVLIIQQLWRIYKKKLGHFEINWYKGEKKICLLITKHKNSQKCFLYACWSPCSLIQGEGSLKIILKWILPAFPLLRKWKCLQGHVFKHILSYQLAKEVQRIM
jgi:hypothetical protein